MTPKIVLTTTGILMLLHGVLFYLELRTWLDLLSPEISEKALRVWIGLAEIVAMVYLLLGVVLIFSRNIEMFLAKKVLTWTGIGYLYLIAGVVKHLIDIHDIPEVIQPMPSVIID